MLAITLLSLTAPLIAHASPILEKRQGGGCKNVYLIHARGTAEPSIGSDLGMLVGQPFSIALQAKFPGNFGSAGVKYSADIIGAITGAINPTGQSGARTMAKMAKDMMSKCPETKIVLSGYSQGAEQVHGALKNLGTDAAKIGAVVTFGDPMNMSIIRLTGNILGGWGALPKERAKVFCYAGDPVCGGLGISHLSYASSTGEAASFVVKTVGTIGSGTGSTLASGLAGLIAKGKGGIKMGMLMQKRIS
jgi:cutinase